MFGGINIVGADEERPDELPYSPNEKSIQYALTVSHETLGRTVEIDKEGTIRARAFTDMDGNPIGGGGSTDLTNYYTKPETDDKFQVKGDYLTDFTEEDPTVPPHVKLITTSDIDKWNNPPTGGGGGAVDSVNGKTGAVNLTYSDVGAQVAGNYLTSSSLNGYATETWVNNKGYLTSSSLSGYATQTWVGQNYQTKGSYAASSHNHSGVYQPAGSYAASNHNHSGVYAPASHSHSYAPVSHTHPASNITAGTFGAGNYNISGTLTCTGDLVAFSDERLKENIEAASLGVIGQLRGVTYKRKDTGEVSSGVIAQDLQKACPELVHQEGEYLAVNYNGLIGYLIEEVKALRAELESMRED